MCLTTGTTPRCTSPAPEAIPKLSVSSSTTAPIRTRGTMKAAPPLHWACTYGRVPIARLLIKHGADVNAVNGIGQDSFDLATHKGTTADGAGAPVIPILLAYGATPSEDKLERVFQTAVRMNGSNPNRGPILTWYQENRPELYFSKFCTAQMSPGGM